MLALGTRPEGDDIIMVFFSPKPVVPLIISDLFVKADHPLVMDAALKIISGEQ